MAHRSAVMTRHGRAAVGALRVAWPLVLVVAILVFAAGATVIVRIDIAQRRAAFQTDAGIAYRLLSQRAGQHEAILATLALLAARTDRADHPASRLPALYPQVLAVLRRDHDAQWSDPALESAEMASRETRHAALGPVDAAARQYTVVLAGDPASYALRIDAARMVPWNEWPLERGGDVRVVLAQGERAIVLQEGLSPGAQPFGLTAGFVFAKVLAAPGQPFELRLQRATGPAHWPWGSLAAWLALVATAGMALAAVQNVRRERRRSEELRRIGRIARLDMLGEIAAGMAHELNQPLAATLANASAATRLLDEDPPDLDAARQALSQAANQARRAADVVKRLRRMVESPDDNRTHQPVHLEAMARDVLELRAPELRKRGIDATLNGRAPAVLADPVALEQIMHNLVDNAVHALEAAPAGARQLILTVTSAAGRGELIVRDTGPGIPPAALPRLFEPFFSMRRDGLGLGLPLCESLAQSMGGGLLAANAVPGGAQFTLTLPLAEARS